MVRQHLCIRQRYAPRFYILILFSSVLSRIVISAGSHLPVPGIITHTIPKSPQYSNAFFPQRNLIPRDSYYIEAAWYLCAAVLHQIINGRSGQAHLFGHRYRLQSSRKPSCFAKFHLTKDQIFSVFCNNVNLRITAAEIILQYPISLLFQKFTCYFFIFCTGPSPVFFILQSPFGSDLLPVLTDFYTKCPIKLLLWIGVGPSV